MDTNVQVALVPDAACQISFTEPRLNVVDVFGYRAPSDPLTQGALLQKASSWQKPLTYPGVVAVQYCPDPAGGCRVTLEFAKPPDPEDHAHIIAIVRMLLPDIPNV